VCSSDLTKTKNLAAQSNRHRIHRNRRAVASTNSSNSKNSRVEREAKRAQPIPQLHVGSAQAELVGTTADGHWILSVADTGERVIVPPPPGFNP